MDSIRKELLPGVFLTCVHAVKFKTGLLSAHFVTPLDKRAAAPGALLPAVLRRGTVRCPDMRSLSRTLDLMYGAGVSYTVRKLGENQCLGFVMSFIDDAYAPGGEHLVEQAAALLGELLLEPVTRGGRFLSRYVDSEKANLIDAIRGLIDDKRDYADARLLREMCRGERYGVPRLGTEERVAKLNNQTLYLFYQQLLAQSRLELFYCGSASFGRVEDALDRALAALPRGQLTAPAEAERRSAPGTPRRVVETLDVTQGKLAMGFRAADDDPAALLLMNLIFGGYSNSRLFLNVREKLSLCYYASSVYHRAKGLVTVSSGIEFEDEPRVRDEILAQLRAVQDGPLAPWELEGAKSVMLSAIAQRGDSAFRMEEQALARAAAQLRETDDELADRIRAVTAERVAEAARSLTLDTIYFLTGEEAAAHD